MLGKNGAPDHDEIMKYSARRRAGSRSAQARLVRGVCQRLPAEAGLLLPTQVVGANGFRRLPGANWRRRHSALRERAVDRIPGGVQAGDIPARQRRLSCRLRGRARCGRGEPGPEVQLIAPAASGARASGKYTHRLVLSTNHRRGRQSRQVQKWCGTAAVGAVV